MMKPAAIATLTLGILLTMSACAVNNDNAQDEHDTNLADNDTDSTTDGPNVYDTVTNITDPYEDSDSQTNTDPATTDTETETDTGYTQSISLTPTNLFFVERSVRTSYAYVDMWFAPPTELEATRYTLQYSDDERVTWQNFQYSMADLTTDVFDDVTTADNFSIDIGADMWLRLLIEGGPYDGDTSNEEWVTRCITESYVSSWSLDESIGNTGVIAPNVGYGLRADFVVTSYSQSIALDNVLTYQWYRVNPSDFEDKSAIPDATTLEYTTTSSDRGYQMLIRADGTDTDFDGFVQILSSFIVR